MPSREAGQRLADAVFGRTSSSTPTPQQQRDAAARIARREAEAEAARFAREQRIEQSVYEVPSEDEFVPTFEAEQRRDELQRDRDEARHEQERADRNAAIRARRLAHLKGGGSTRIMAELERSMRAVSTFARSARLQAPREGLTIGSPELREFERLDAQIEAAVRDFARQRLTELRTEYDLAKKDRERLIADLEG